MRPSAREARSMQSPDIVLDGDESPHLSPLWLKQGAVGGLLAVRVRLTRLTELAAACRVPVLIGSDFLVSKLLLPVLFLLPVELLSTLIGFTVLLDSPIVLALLLVAVPILRPTVAMATGAIGM